MCVEDPFSQIWSQFSLVSPKLHSAAKRNLCNINVLTLAHVFNQLPAYRSQLEQPLYSSLHETVCVLHPLFFTIVSSKCFAISTKTICHFVEYEVENPLNFILSLYTIQYRSYGFQKQSHYVQTSSITRLHSNQYHMTIISVNLLSIK